MDASTKKRKRASNYTDAERHAVCSAYYQWAADLPDPKSMSAVSRLNKQQVKNNMLQRIYSNQPQLRDRIKDYSKIMEVVRASKVKARQDVKVAEVSRAERTEEQDQPWYHLSIEAPRDVQRTQPAATHADRSAGTDWNRSDPSATSISVSHHVHTQLMMLMIAAGAESQAESGVADPGQSYKDTAGVDVHASSGQLLAIAFLFDHACYMSRTGDRHCHMNSYNEQLAIASVSPVVFSGSCISCCAYRN